MGWTWTDQVVLPVVKVNGLCYKKAQWKYCPYWQAKHDSDSRVVLGYKCSLFDLDKDGANSLPQCNAQYGRTYDGRP